VVLHDPAATPQQARRQEFLRPFQFSQHSGSTQTTKADAEQMRTQSSSSLSLDLQHGPIQPLKQDAVATTATRFPVIPFSLSTGEDLSTLVKVRAASSPESRIPQHC
jgi:hypothetical protein